MWSMQYGDSEAPARSTNTRWGGSRSGGMGSHLLFLLFNDVVPTRRVRCGLRVPKGSWGPEQLDGQWWGGGTIDRLPPSGSSTCPSWLTASNLRKAKASPVVVLALAGHKAIAHTQPGTVPAVRPAMEALEEQAGAPAAAARPESQSPMASRERD